MSAEETFFKLTKIQRILIVAAVCSLLLVAFYFLYVADTLVAIEGVEKKIASLQTDIKNEERILAEGPKLRARIAELKKELEAMVASLPEKQDIEELLRKITELQSETNLVSTQFVPGKEVVNKELYYAKIPLQFVLRGDYQRHGTFLAGINNLPRVVNIPGIILSKAGGMPARERDMVKKLELISLDAKITGETYRRLSPEEIKSIGDKKKPPPKKKR